MGDPAPAGGRKDSSVDADVAGREWRPQFEYRRCRNEPAQERSHSTSTGVGPCQRSTLTIRSRTSGGTQAANRPRATARCRTDAPAPNECRTGHRRSWRYSGAAGRRRASRRDRRAGPGSPTPTTRDRPQGCHTRCSRSYPGTAPERRTTPTSVWSKGRGLPRSCPAGAARAGSSPPSRRPARSTVPSRCSTSLTATQTPRLL